MIRSNRYIISGFLFMIIIFFGSTIILPSPSISIHLSLGEPSYVREAGDSNNINSSSLSIEKLASISIPGMLCGIQVVNKIAYIGDHSYGLKIYNMSNPENPLLMGSTDLPGIYHDLYVDVERKLAYLADLEDGLEILDISILSNPIHVGNYSVGEQNARYIYALDDLLFLANYETGLEIFNVSDPSNPTKLGSYEITNGCILEHVSDNIAYLSSGGMELIILNVTNPFQPVKLGGYRDDEPVRAFYVDPEKNLAIINSLNSIKIIDLSDPTHPEFLGENNEVKPSYTFGIFKENDLAYIGEFEDGLAILNMSNPDNPLLLHKYTDDGGVGWVFSEDDIVYVGIVYSRLRVLRISFNMSTETTTTESASPSFELLVVFMSFIIYCGIKKYRHRKRFKFNIKE